MLPQRDNNVAVAGQRCCRSAVIGWKIRMGDGMGDTCIFQISTSLFWFRLPFIISELGRQKSQNGRYGRFFTQLILFKSNLEHTEVYWGRCIKKRLSVEINSQSSTVPRPGLEPGWVAPLVFETSASTDSAIWALAFCVCKGTLFISFRKTFEAKVLRKRLV